MILALMLAGQAALAGADPSPATPVPFVRESEVRLSDPFGTCESNGRSFDLRRLALLADPTIEIDGPDGALRVTLDGEIIRIDEIGDGSVTQVFATNIGSRAEPNVDLDIKASLGYSNHRLVMYWKETYRHRIYRQRLFSIVNETIEPLCEGRGGVTAT